MRTLLFLLALLGVAYSIGNLQSAAVKGILMCDGKPAQNVKVKLWDEDDTDADDLLDQGSTDAQGHFQLSGTETEVTTIDPKLNIYHDCNDGIKPCQRKFTIKIPDSYISTGKTPKKVYDAGTINLAGKYPGEERDCLN